MLGALELAAEISEPSSPEPMGVKPRTVDKAGVVPSHRCFFFFLRPVDFPTNGFALMVGIGKRLSSFVPLLLATPAGLL